jgi:DNA-binding transcriptional MerR regulator
MPPKLYKATDVCDMTQLQPYVLRSWEKEFPGIGVQAADGPRLYRQSDIDQVLRIKQLVFGEGLTLSGARRRLEADPSAIVTPPLSIPSHQPDVPEPEADDDRLQPVDGYDELRVRLASVREGLQGILDLLSREQKPPADTPGPMVEEDYRLEASPLAADDTRRNVRKLTTRRAPEKPKKPAAVAKKKRASA